MLFSWVSVNIRRIKAAVNNTKVINKEIWTGRIDMWDRQKQHSEILFHTVYFFKKGKNKRNIYYV